jgi:uncharacterized membrane-anchored protein YhcB (DUF1043 family)
MQTKSVPLFVFLFVLTSLFSQENSNTIDNQFTNVIDKSHNYREFKIIPKAKIYALRKNVLDSMATLESKVETAQAETEKQRDDIASLTDRLTSTQQNLESSKEKEDGIEFFGSITKKSTYHTIMWSMVVILLAILGLIFFKFTNSNSVTRATKTKLAEVKNEFEAYRKKALEENQRIGRKLHDEINKNRKSQS